MAALPVGSLGLMLRPRLTPRGRKLPNCCVAARVPGRRSADAGDRYSDGSLPRCARSAGPGASGAAAAYAPELSRYPYLTDTIGSTATVNWATDRSHTTGRVRYGGRGSRPARRTRRRRPHLDHRQRGVRSMHGVRTMNGPRAGRALLLPRRVRERGAGDGPARRGPVHLRFQRAAPGGRRRRPSRSPCSATSAPSGHDRGGDGQPPGGT